ncbi:cysteine methyltransferase [Microlunatus sp. Gsoil 973]|nr:cysteine methyltransferase [Microlunatus sp. Gsoil 973]
MLPWSRFWEDASVRDEFVEAVLSAVESIPAGQVASYGDIAEFVGAGGPRQVGSVMSHYGGAVCWWRVVRADGRPADGLLDRALALLAEDGAPIRNGRVVMREARWHGPV